MLYPLLHTYMLCASASLPAVYSLVIGRRMIDGYIVSEHKDDREKATLNQNHLNMGQALMNTYFTFTLPC
jgi:hypothetical protein